jgi:uncharacterized membrane protein HdeD (DUF308 family)
MSTNPNDPNRSPDHPDPSYQGAKPGSLTAGDISSFFHLDDAGLNNAMSAALARNWWAIALRGVFAIVFGVIAVLMPGLTLASLVLLFGAYMLVDGVFDIVAAMRAARQGERWAWLVVEGIADFVAGAIAFIWPLATIFAFVILMAVWAIVSGAMLSTAALHLNLSHGRWLMALGGVISILWGVLLILSPAVGALVVTLWMGGYALFFGGALLVLAFQLRRRRRDRFGTAAAGA